MTRFVNFGVLIREKVWLENSLLLVTRYPPQPVSVLGPSTTLSPPFLLAQAIFEPKRFPYKHSNIFKPSHPSNLPAYEDGTECSETSAYKIQTPGNYPEKKRTTTSNCVDCNSFIIILEKRDDKLKIGFFQ